MTLPQLVRKKTLPFLAVFGLTLAVLGVLGAASQRALAADSGLCFDKLIGSTYGCTNPPAYPIDGKSGGSFASGKCYVFADPEKGWETDDCSKDVYAKSSVNTHDSRITSPADKANDCSIEGGCDIIARYANPLITGLSAIVGVVVVIMIVVGGIQYASSRDNPQAVSAAKRRITNAILGLLAYSLLYFFLEWIIPGGFFS